MPNYHYQQITISVRGDDGALAKASREIVRILDGMPGACLGELQSQGDQLKVSLSIPAVDFEGFRRLLGRSGSHLLRQISGQSSYRKVAA